jgi:ABC-type Fe3+/spermidine/putrescine transport system ATPase subunit
MVFQSYALYPHMTVHENMAFALKLAGKPKAEIEAAVMKAAQALQIVPLLTRRPRELSGGQRQRVAIGRAIVREPAVFLFGEPLSNLDASLRVQMRIELAKLHRALATTMIYVTHDQVEAMTLADRIVVLNGGRIRGRTPWRRFVPVRDGQRQHRAGGGARRRRTRLPGRAGPVAGRAASAHPRVWRGRAAPARAGPRASLR